MKAPRFPEHEECFLCNQAIRFNDDEFDVAVSFSHLPRGAKRPSSILWAHDSCARKAAHEDYEMPSSDG